MAPYFCASLPIGLASKGLKCSAQAQGKAIALQRITSVHLTVALLLEDAGLDPGFLVGGVPGNFGISARLGSAPFFVVEADEYDTAFFDKRSKFVHYRPRTLILNNLEFDHADIFPDLEAIQRQFHHLVRTVPGSGLIVANGADAHIADTLQMGCWTPVETFAAAGGTADWTAGLGPDGRLEIERDGRVEGRADWTMPGLHNAENALAAALAARHAGVPLASSLDALGRFAGIRRRMEERGRVGGVTVYDHLAHHPTAIARTLDGLRRAGRTSHRARMGKSERGASVDCRAEGNVPGCRHTNSTS